MRDNTRKTTYKLTAADLVRAAKLWRSGEELEAGRLLFEAIEPDYRPRWAVNILNLVIQKTAIHTSEIDAILRIANQPSEWTNGHNAFTQIRDETLRLDSVKQRSMHDEILHAQLCLAELVAKVTYNATNPVDGFDRDSGWWIAACLKDALNLIADDKFSETMWLALSEPTRQP